jgi:hypothetical protein
MFIKFVSGVATNGSSPLRRKYGSMVGWLVFVVI